VSPGHRWEDTEIYLKEMGHKVVGWIYLAQDKDR
jgi:hypothetical protein